MLSLSGYEAWIEVTEVSSLLAYNATADICEQ